MYYFIQSVKFRYRFVKILYVMYDVKFPTGDMKFYTSPTQGLAYNDL